MAVVWPDLPLEATLAWLWYRSTGFGQPVKKPGAVLMLNA